MNSKVSTARIAFARLTAASTFVLVFAGGLVTSTGSALAVPDWPLSFGQLFPPMVGGIFYEHGHRMIAGTVAILTTILAVWTWRTEPRPGVRYLGVACVVAVLVQAGLGGITVLFLLPTAVSVSHACLGQVFFCMTVAMALVVSPAWTRPSNRVREAELPLRLLALASATAIFGQLLLGALMRHTGAGLAIPDFPLAFGRIVPELTSTAVTIHFAHRVWALVVALLIFATAARAASASPGLRRPAFAMAGLVVLQILLGGLAVWTRTAPFPTTIHVATGAALLATSIVLTLRTWRGRDETSPALGMVPGTQGRAA